MVIWEKEKEKNLMQMRHSLPRSYCEMINILSKDQSRFLELPWLKC